MATIEYWLIDLKLQTSAVNKQSSVFNLTTANVIAQFVSSYLQGRKTVFESEIKEV